MSIFHFRRLSVVLLPLAVLSASPASAVNLEASGNLRPTNKLGCVASGSLKNVFTPVDLYLSSAECVKRGDYSSAFASNALAGVYARYDSMRVSDRTAHQAQTVLKMQMATMLTPDERRIFKDAVVSVTNNPAKLAAFCADIRRIGPPQYHPSYMIQHGMAAFQAKTAGNGLVDQFDGSAAWEKSLDSYLHCPSKKG